MSALWLIQQTNNRSLLACMCLTDFQRSIDLVYLTLYASARCAHMLGFDRKSRSFIYLFHIKIYFGKDLHTFQVSTHFLLVRWPQAHASTRLPLDPNVIYLHYSDLSYFKHLFIWSLTYVYFIFPIKFTRVHFAFANAMQCDAMHNNRW